MTIDRSIRQLRESIEMGTPRFAKIRQHPYLPWLLLGLFVIALACLHVWQRFTVIETGREVQKLTAERTRLQDESRKLSSQIAQLSMASRISRYVADSLGMRPIPPGQLFTVIEQRPPALQLDDFSTMVASLERLADYFPVQATAQAITHEAESIRFDTLTADRASE